jgi:hypothetical protein
MQYTPILNTSSRTRSLETQTRLPALHEWPVVNVPCKAPRLPSRSTRRIGLPLPSSAQMPRRSSSKRYINVEAQHTDAERPPTPWYWRLIALVAAWMILGGYAAFHSS